MKYPKFIEYDGRTYVCESWEEEREVEQEIAEKEKERLERERRSRQRIPTPEELERIRKEEEERRRLEAEKKRKRKEVAAAAIIITEGAVQANPKLKYIIAMILIAVAFLASSMVVAFLFPNEIGAIVILVELILGVIGWIFCIWKLIKDWVFEKYHENRVERELRKSGRVIIDPRYEKKKRIVLYTVIEIISVALLFVPYKELILLLTADYSQAYEAKIGGDTISILLFGFGVIGVDLVVCLLTGLIISLIVSAIIKRINKN